MRRTTALASVLVAWFLSFAPVAPAQSIADRLPEGTLIYLEAVGHRNVSTFAPSHAGQLLLSPEMQKLHASVFPTLIKLAQQEGDEEAINALKLVSQLVPALLQDGGAIYLSSLDVTGPRAGFVVKAPGQGKPLFDQHPDVFLKVMENDSVRLRQAGDYAVFGIGYPAADAVLPDAPLPEKSLAASPRFKAAFSSFQHDALFRIYVDVAGLHKAISAIADIPEAEDLRDYPKIAEVLGLASADTLAVSTGVHGKNWRNELFLASTSPRGILGMLIKPGAGVDASVLTAIPADATLAAISTLDLAALLEATRGMVDAHAPEYTEQFNSYLGLASQTLGTDIPKEVLPHLGATWAVYRAPSVAGNGLLGTVFINKLKDPAKAAAGIEKLGQGINRTLLSLSQTPFPRFTFRSTTIDGVAVRILPMALVNFSVTVQGDFLVIGLQPQSAVAAARYITAPDGKPNLASAAGYKQALARLGAPPTAATSYLDLPAFAPTGYQTLILLANFLGGSSALLGADVPVAQLPPYYKVAPFFSSDIAATWTDNTGLHFRSETPFPLANLVAADFADLAVTQGAGAISVFLPAINRSREMSNRIRCATNLRMISQGLQLYAQENQDRLPDNLGQLLLTQELGAAAFACPASGDQAFRRLNTPEELSTWASESGSYQYFVAGLTSNVLGPEIIVAAEREGAHNYDGRNALFGDGHVEFIPEDDFAARLAESNAKIEQFKATGR